MELSFIQGTGINNQAKAVPTVPNQICTKTMHKEQIHDAIHSFGARMSVNLR
jgi:hypothetical protein